MQVTARQTERRGGWAERWLLPLLLSAFVLWASGGALLVHQLVAHAPDKAAHAAHDDQPGGDSESDCVTCHFLAHASALPNAPAVGERLEPAPECLAVSPERLPRTFLLTSAAPRGPPLHV